MRKKIIFLIIFPPITFALLLLYYYLTIPKLKLSEWDLPTRLYSSPPYIFTGVKITPQKLISILKDSSYVEREKLRPGSFHKNRLTFTIYRRDFLTPSKKIPESVVTISLKKNSKGSYTVKKITVNGFTVTSVTLEPVAIGTFFSSKKIERIFATLNDIGRYPILAVIASEDPNFFNHYGFSLTAIIRALIKNLVKMKVIEGGSTITQQLVKNLYLSPDKSFKRKIKELLISLYLERNYSKWDILQAYLNEVYFGAVDKVQLKGIAAASYTYFATAPKHLSLGEAAMLAGIIPAPAKLSPLTNYKKAIERRNAVLKKLYKLGWIKKEELENAINEKIVVNSYFSASRKDSWFNNLVREKIALDSHTLQTSALNVITSLNYNLQKEVEKIVSKYIPTLRKKGLEIALVILDSSKGDIVVYIGGSDYQKTQFDRVSHAKRQLGSVFKPFIYALALENNIITPFSLLEDRRRIIVKRGSRWEPKNWDGKVYGKVTAEFALARSLNLATLDLASRLGIHNIYRFAKTLGFICEPFPSIALGTVEASPLQVAKAFAIFGNGGKLPSAKPILAIFDFRGNLIRRFPTSTKAILSPRTTYLISDMLKKVSTIGTASALKRYGLSGLPVKTGTTNGGRDAWLAGIVQSKVLVVWIGNDHGKPKRLTGSKDALPIWAEVAQKIQEEYNIN